MSPFTDHSKGPYGNESHSPYYYTREEKGRKVKESYRVWKFMGEEPEKFKRLMREKILKIAKESNL